MTDSHKGHRARLRERLMNGGFGALSHAQILELLLFNTIPRRDTLPTAERLLERFNTLNGVFSADISELTAMSGVSKTTAVMLKALKDIYIEYAEPDFIGKISADYPDVIEKHIKSLLKSIDGNALAAVFLDDEGYAARSEILSPTISSAKKLAAIAKEHNLKSAIIALCGDCDFSQESEDYLPKLLESLSDTLKSFGVEVSQTLIIKNM